MCHEFAGGVEPPGCRPRAGEIGTQRSGGEVHAIEDVVRSRQETSRERALVFAACQSLAMIRWRSPSRSASSATSRSAAATSQDA